MIRNISPFDRFITEKTPDNFSNGSWISGADYGPDEKVMRITMDGRDYHFCEVPKRLFTSFRKSASKGKFYNKYIKDKYTC